jgi:hypothetical protein
VDLLRILQRMHERQVGVSVDLDATAIVQTPPGTSTSCLPSSSPA